MKGKPAIAVVIAKEPAESLATHFETQMLIAGRGRLRKLGHEGDQPGTPLGDLGRFQVNGRMALPIWRAFPIRAIPPARVLSYRSRQSR